MIERILRCVLIAAVLVAAIAILVIFVAPYSWSATTGPRARVAIGSNVRTYPRFKAAIPAARAVRIYYDSTDPADWPATCPQLEGRPWMLISFRPMPGPLLSGHLDKWFRAWFATCPHHTDVTIWHENANGKPGCTVGPCNPLGYPRALRDPARFRAMQVHMERLTKGTHVRFGVLGCGPVSSAPEWYAPHLDWYGNDLYLNSKYLTGGGLRKSAVLPGATSGGTLSKAKVWARMSANLAAFRRISGEKYPRIDLGESNASPDSYRRAWFTDVVTWFDSHDGRRPGRVLTFWRAKGPGTGGLSGPWPPSAGVITTLRQLAQAHQ
jgi:hypothetical protein